MKVSFVKPPLRAEASMARRLQQALAPQAHCTELVRLRDDLGQTRLLIIERGRRPREGDWMVLATDRGWRARRYVHGCSLPEDLWGVITWVIRRPS